MSNMMNTRGSWGEEGGENRNEYRKREEIENDTGLQ